MVIEGKDFKLTPVSDSSPFFDLELLYTIKPKSKETRQEFKNVAYGISLETAIKKIIQYRILHKYDITDLATYLKEFRAELDLLRKICDI